MYTIRVIADEPTAALIERRCHDALSLSGAAQFWDQADAVATIATLAVTTTVDLPATLANARLLWSCVVARLGTADPGEQGYSLTVSVPGKRVDVVSDEPIGGAEELISFLQRNGLLEEQE